MLVKIVKSNQLELSAFSIPTLLAEDDEGLRRFFYYFAQSCPYERLLCFWLKLTDGQLRVYFLTQAGIESRTYSPSELSEAIIEQRSLFAQSVEKILTLLEERPLPQFHDPLLGLNLSLTISTEQGA